MSSAAQTPARERRLDSWKQIAGYLDKSIKTVRRWELTEGLPVHKHVHQMRPSVFAYEHEIDEWLEQRRTGPQRLVDSAGPVVAKRTIRWSAAGLAVLASLVTWLLLSRAEEPLEIRSAPVTALAGEEYTPTVSPDRRTIAFFWQHPEPGRSGIYRKSLESNTDQASPVMVSANDLNFSPVWSPDGQWIAYIRHSANGENWLRLMSPDGTRDRALYRVAPLGLYNLNVTNMSWGPSSRWLMVRVVGDERTIQRVSLDGQGVVVARAVLIYSPGVAPDGHAMAFQRRHSPSPEGHSEVLVQALDQEGFPAGEPKVIYHTAGSTRGLAWSPGGDGIVICGEMPRYGWRLFQIATDGSTGRGAPVKPLGDNDCMTVTVSRPDAAGRSILLYGTSSQTRLAKLWQAPLNRLEDYSEFAPSSRASRFPRFAPDGSAMAFVSERSGQPEIWRSGADGSQPVRLTTDSGVDSPAEWSPDGSRLIYASSSSKPSGLMVVPAGGGTSTPVGLGGHYARYGIWSRNSDYLFYSSSAQFWRMRPDGSNGLVFEGEHTYAGESPDGGHLYFVHQLSDLVRVPSGGGPAERMETQLSVQHTAVTRKSVYFMRGRNNELYRRPLSGGAAVRLGVLHSFANVVNLRPTSFGLAVSPDEKRIVWAAQDPQIDIEMIRDFR